LSARMRFGDRGRAALREKVDSHYIAGVSLYASGRIEEAVLEWERALSLDPSFDPAREAREIAVRFLGVKDDIMGIQRFSVE
ncbi:tetratricopeptide repeat protein, partial [Treponema saccharophilum]